MIMQDSQTRRIVEVLIHIIGWGIVFAFPFLLMNRSGFTVSWVDYLRHGSAVPVSFLIVFYLNYCFFIPRFLFDGQCKPLTDVIEKADLVFYFAFVGLYVVRNKPKM